MTDALYKEDAYLRTCEAEVVEVLDTGAFILNRTVFYAKGGGQPGDSGYLELEDGVRINIADTVFDSDKNNILHIPEDSELYIAPGAEVTAHIDWARRYKLMRMHTALHLLSVALPFPVTGGQIGEQESRLDFDMGSQPVDKDELVSFLNRLVSTDHDVTSEWISDEKLLENPNLIKTMAVKPPLGTGHVRLVRIGTDVDLQPCGGTHVSRTSEIGELALGKIEKKGKQNRRVRIRLLD